MGHNRPKGAPFATTRLTPKQFDLLTWVYLAGYRDVGNSQITWSPQAYIGRSPSRSESATLSKRVSTLVDHELLSRWGRDLKLTNEGTRLLRLYVLENPDEPGNRILSIRLNLDEDIQTLGAYSKVQKALRDYQTDMKLSQEEANKAIEGILPLYRALIKRIEDGAIQLDAELAASRERAEQLPS